MPVNNGIADEKQQRTQWIELNMLIQPHFDLPWTDFVSVGVIDSN